jgi:NAD(P)-dependent dehydrogenase (short-subunit alcohol dehydrogenase family)
MRIAPLFALSCAAYTLARRTRSRRALRGQRVLVTGGSRGLGLLLAREFRRRGCRVAICARDAAELAEAKQRLGGDVVTAVCDVGDAAAVRSTVEDVSRQLGGIDVLVNNAGQIEVGPLDQLREEDFDRALRVMLWGILHATFAVLPQMRARRRGRIVNITSIGGRLSVPHLLPYSVAKFAAVGFSEGLRAELAGSGVRVVTVVPGLMRTGSYLNARFRGRRDAELAWFAAGATLPGISIDAERAARHIVVAAARGRSDLVISVPAKLAAAFHGLFPGTTADLLGLVDRLLLPRPKGNRRARSGWELAPRQPRWFALMTTLGRIAARRFQIPAGRPSAPAVRGGA